MEPTTLEVTGMTCGHCRKAVQEALEGVAGVKRVEVDLDAGRVTVDGRAVPGDLIAAVEAEGYGAEVRG